MKKPVRTLLIVVFAVVILCLVRDFILKSIITSVASKVVGARIEMGGFSLSLIGQSVKITDFKMYSPDGFPNEVMADIPLIRATCDAGAFFRGKVHLKEAALTLRQLVMVKNKDGKLNVDSLKIVQKGQNAGEKQEEPSKPIGIQIDQVDLNVGNIVSRDESTTPPVIKVYNVGINKTYRNITSVQQLAGLIIAEPLKAAGIQGLKVYGVAMLTGVAALPVAAAFLFTGKDYARSVVPASWDEAYAKSLEAMKESGTIVSQNKDEGTIVATVDGAKAILKIRKQEGDAVEVTVSARKLMLPQPGIAGGVLYRLSQKLK